MRPFGCILNTVQHLYILHIVVEVHAILIYDFNSYVFEHDGYTDADFYDNGHKQAYQRA